MNGIKMSNCKFYVDENARTIICVIPNTKYMLYEFVKDHFQFHDIAFLDAMFCTFEGAFEQKMHMPKSFVGKAVCAKEDKWNEELGRLIAFSRAKNKCYKSFFKRANLMVQTIDLRLGDMISLFNDFGEKLNNKKQMLEAKIEHMTQKE